MTTSIQEWKNKFEINFTTMPKPTKKRLVDFIRKTLDAQRAEWTNGVSTELDWGVVELFWSRINKTDTCWLYEGSLTNGYGQFSYNGVKELAHRFAWRLVHGTLPDKNSGLNLDHTCRVRNCVNPAHLELVTIKENVLRGVGLTAQNARKTHCSRGHELKGDNIFPRKDGRRYCKICDKLYIRKPRSRPQKPRDWKRGPNYGKTIKP